jgi:hypothetical protein
MRDEEVGKWRGRGEKDDGGRAGENEGREVVGAGGKKRKGLGEGAGHSHDRHSHDWGGEEGGRGGARYRNQAGEIHFRLA